MADDGHRRVETPLSRTYGGLRATPEQIERMEAHRREADKLAAAGRPGVFDRLMTVGAAASPSAATAAPAAKTSPRPRPAPSPPPGGPRPAGLVEEGEPAPPLAPGPTIIRG